MGDTTEVGLPRTLAIAWGMQVVPQRGPSRGLSHERIVAAGIEIADNEGLAAVTMQRVAESLGFTTMSLYRYVSGKEELLALMLDAASEPPKDFTVDDDWRVAIREWAALLRAGSERHPWTLELPRTQLALLMPNAMTIADLGLRSLASLEVSEEDRLAVILMVSQHVLSMVSLQLSLAGEGGLYFGPEAAQMLGEVITVERFPTLGPLMHSGEYVLPPTPIEEPDTGIEYEYEFGLDMIIAGLERRAGGD